jgi:hypothetical protein
MRPTFNNLTMLYIFSNIISYNKDPYFKDLFINKVISINRDNNYIYLVSFNSKLII